MSVCDNCTYRKAPARYACVKCNANPDFTNMFSSEDKYYPLEFNHNEINLWASHGQSKCTIAMFKQDKEDCWSLEFIGNRPMDKRVDRGLFFELIELGYAVLKENE